MKLQFKKITPEVFEKLKVVMNKIGVDIAGDSGDISTKGIKGSFQRDQDNHTLEININKTPFILPKSLIESKIKDAVKDSGGEVV